MLIYLTKFIWFLVGTTQKERRKKIQYILILLSDTAQQWPPTVTTSFLSSLFPSLLGDLHFPLLEGGGYVLVHWLPSNGKWDTPSVTRSLPATGFLAFALGPSDTWRKLSVTHCQPLDRITMMGLFPLGMGCKTHSLWGWWSDSFPKSEINMAGWKKNGF